MSELTTGVDPPNGSDSAIAKQKLSDNFRQPPVMLTVLVSSRDGKPLINMDAPFNDPHDIPTALTPETSKVSHMLHNLSLELNATCTASFASFWDIGDLAASPFGRVLIELLGQFKKHQLFSANGSSTLMVTTITSCSQQDVTAACVNKADFCEPVKAYGDSLKNFASEYHHAHPHDLELMVTSFPDIETAVLGGPPLPLAHPPYPQSHMHH